MNKLKLLLFLSFGLSFLLLADFSFAEEYQRKSFSQFLDYGLERSLDVKASQLDVEYQSEAEKLAKENQLIPQISVSASYQKFIYDHLHDSGNGTLESNDGQNRSIGLILSYDLQKLFGPEASIAKEVKEFASLQSKLVTRDLIRNIKKSYFQISEMQSEIKELSSLITLFSKIDHGLQKQKKMGVYNELERREFAVQKSILINETEVRQGDLDAAYYQLSNLMNADVSDVKRRAIEVSDNFKSRFTDLVMSDPQKVMSLHDQTIFENIRRDLRLSRLEYESFVDFPLPIVFFKQSRDLPTMPSGDGPQYLTEVGVSFQIDSFFTRSTQKSQLGAKLRRSEFAVAKANREYENQVRLNVAHIVRFKSQERSLQQVRNETKNLLDKSFMFYSQKRLDVLGTLDIFQKYLQAVRNDLNNNLQIKNADADLEYLLGGVVE